MPAPHNPCKAALKAGKPQMGGWLGLALGQFRFDTLLPDSL